jgi:hypothetical protein
LEKFVKKLFMMIDDKIEILGELKETWRREIHHIV